MDRRAFLRNAGLTGLALAGAGVLGACSTDDGDQTEAGPKDSISTEVMIGTWPIAPVGVPYMVGLERGFFEDQGWDITEVLGGTGGGQEVRNVVVGNLPVGDVAVPAAIQAWAQGAPIRMIAAGANSHADGLWIRRPDTEHVDFDSLRGKKIGYTSPGSTTQATLALCLDRVGLTDEVETVSTGGLDAGLALLDGGDLDYMSTIEAFYWPTRDRYEVAWRLAELVPEYAQSTLIVGETFYKEQPVLIEKFLGACRLSVEALNADRAEAARIWAGLSEGPVGAAESSLNIQGENYYAVNNEFSRTALDSVVEALILTDARYLSPDDVPLNEIIDQKFIAEEYRIDL